MTVLSRSFRVTWRGGITVALMLAVGYASLYKSSNLLFAVFSLLVGLFLTSLLLTLSNAHRIEIQRLVPDSIYANETFTYILRIRNAKRLLPTFCLKVEDHVLFDMRPAPIPPSPIYVPTAAPQERVRATVSATAYQRGWAKFPRLTLTSESPPGFFSYRCTIALEDALLVFPREAVLQRGVLHRALSRIEFLDRATVATVRGTEAFAGVREYRPGDNPHWIHWKLSARAPHRLLIKELEDPRVKDAAILLESHIPNPADLRRVARLERAICFTAALARLLLDEDYTVRFQSFTPEHTELRLEPRANSLDPLQFILASMRASRTHTLSELLPESELKNGTVTFVLRIGDDLTPLPMPRDRAIEIHADSMRSMMYYIP